MQEIEFGRRLESALEAGDQRSAEFADLDGFYVIWTGELFRGTKYFLKANYDRLLKDNPRFLGLLVGPYAPAADGPYASLPRVTAEEFLAERATRRVGLIQFFTTRFEAAFWASLRPYTMSFISGLDAMGAAHTYVPVRAERDFIRANIARYADMMTRFEDEGSCRMLSARLQGIAALDTEPMMQNNVPPAYQYFNSLSRDYSLLLRDREDLIDVGASWGDYVVKFFDEVKDVANSTVNAFEPNAKEFAPLKTIEAFLPVTAHNTIVSDVTGTGYFHTQLENIGGSHIAETGSEADIRPTVRLDDACEKATLIKIDAEGAEPKILRGAERLLSNPDCRLASCVYHYPGDLFETVDIMAQYGRTRLSFRQYGASMYDAMVYFD
ncbi:MAG TPA: FkbM family methyltransferase [Caulobacteraceae bacterium]|jgi:FkbM family methyltransferase